jgi:adenine C2-methylase RlmN of 23S rRNA A2503 and tRNA A37
LQLAEDLPGVSLALSLHAPEQELRKSIVPSAAAYKLDRLMAAVATYQQKTRQKARWLEHLCPAMSQAVEV